MNNKISFNKLTILTEQNIALCFVVIPLLFLFFYALTGYSQYGAIYEDESFIAMAARNFVTNYSVATPLCIDGHVAKIFSAGWYGIGYNIHFGIFSYLLGNNNFAFVIHNLLFFILTLILIYKTFKHVNFILIFMSYFIVLPLLFSFFPETLNAFFGVSLICLLYTYSQKQEIEIKNIYFYFAVINFFIIYRVTWCSWIIGVLPFLNRKNITHFFVCSIFTIVFTLLYYTKFCAKPYVSTAPFLLNSNMLQVIVALLKNIKISCGMFFVQAKYYPVKYYLLHVFMFFSIVFLFIRYIKLKDKLLLSYLLIITGSLLLHFATYTMVHPYVHKQLTSTFIVTFFAAYIAWNNLGIKNFNLAFKIIVFPCILFSYYSAYQEIKYHKLEYKFFVDFSSKQNEINALVKKYALQDNSKNEIVIWFDRINFQKEIMPSYIFYQGATLCENKHKIRYSGEIKEHNPGVFLTTSNDLRYETLLSSENYKLVIHK